MGCVHGLPDPSDGGILVIYNAVLILACWIIQNKDLSFSCREGLQPCLVRTPQRDF